MALDWGQLAKGVGQVIGAGGGSKAKPEKINLIKSKQSANDTGDISGDEPSGGSYKKGGKVKRTGLAKVHKGERVLTRKQAKKYERKKGKK